MSTTRLDNTLNKSDIDISVNSVKAQAQRNNAWAESHILVDNNGEILSDDEGNIITLAEMSRSWYSENGGRNNTRNIIHRLDKAHKHPASVKAYRPKFITLTFANVSESWNAERAIQKFTDALRKWAKRHNSLELAYFWTAEVQKRGALHYHLLVLGLPYLPKKVIESWWTYGFVDIRMVDDIGRAFKYLAKYCWKWGKLAGDPDNLPDWWFYFSVYSKRRYGFSSWFRLPPLERIPSWLRKSIEEMRFLGELEKAKRAVGGGWLLSFQMEGSCLNLFFPSIYQVVERKQ